MKSLGKLILSACLLTSLNSFAQIKAPDITNLGVSAVQGMKLTPAHLRGVGLEFERRNMKSLNFFDLTLNLNEIRTLGVTNFMDDIDDGVGVALIAIPIHYMKEVGTGDSYLQASLGGLTGQFSIKDKGSINVGMVPIAFNFLNDDNSTLEEVRDHFFDTLIEQGNHTEEEIEYIRESILDSDFMDYAKLHTDGFYIVPIRSKYLKKLKSITLKWSFDIGISSLMNDQYKIQKGVGTSMSSYIQANVNVGRFSPFVGFSHMNTAIEFKDIGAKNFGTRRFKIGTYFSF